MPSRRELFSDKARPSSFLSAVYSMMLQCRMHRILCCVPRLTNHKVQRLDLKSNGTLAAFRENDYMAADSETSSRVFPASPLRPWCVLHIAPCDSDNLGLWQHSPRAIAPQQLPDRCGATHIQHQQGSSLVPARPSGRD